MFGGKDDGDGVSSNEMLSTSVNDESTQVCKVGNHR